MDATYLCTMLPWHLLCVCRNSEIVECSQRAKPLNDHNRGLAIIGDCICSMFNILSFTGTPHELNFWTDLWLYHMTSTQSDIATVRSFVLRLRQS